MGKSKLGLIGKMTLGIFPNSIYLIRGSDISDGIRRAERMYNFKATSEDYSSYNAITFPLGGKIIIVGTTETKRNEWVHELVHAGLEVMKYTDIPINYENSEVICYIIDHIYEKLSVFLPN